MTLNKQSLENIVGKEKMLVTSIFSFSNIVLCPVKNRNHLFSNTESSPDILSFGYELDLWKHCDQHFLLLFSTLSKTKCIILVMLELSSVYAFSKRSSQFCLGKGKSFLSSILRWLIQTCCQARLWRVRPSRHNGTLVYVYSCVWKSVWTDFSGP